MYVCTAAVSAVIEHSTIGQLNVPPYVPRIPVYREIRQVLAVQAAPD